MNAPHVLIVRPFDADDPDLFMVEHRSSCPVGRYGGSDNDYYEEWECGVALHEDAGLSCFFRHADDPNPADLRATPVGPGRHLIEAWNECVRVSGPWGPAEWDGGLRLVETAPTPVPSAGVLSSAPGRCVVCGPGGRDWVRLVSVEPSSRSVDLLWPCPHSNVPPGFWPVPIYEYPVFRDVPRSGDAA